MKKGAKFYVVFNEEDVNEQNPDAGYWNQYSTIEDAVSDVGDGCEVFVCEPKLVGQFKRTVELVKIKKKKARRNK